jgi:hypothetical protein
MERRVAPTEYGRGGLRKGMRVRWSESWSVSCARTPTAVGTAEEGVGDTAPDDRRDWLARVLLCVALESDLIARYGRRSARGRFCAFSARALKIRCLRADFVSKPAASPAFGPALTVQSLGAQWRSALRVFL